MRPAWYFVVVFGLVLAACAETPRCVERGTPPQLQIECNPGKVPVCGSDPMALYDENGRLRPVPHSSVADGLCPAGEENCRTRPICQQDTRTVVCNDGTSPTCVLGAIDELDPPPQPMPDSGAPDRDAGGSEDAGSDDDAGPDDDAGSTDDAGA